MRNLLLGLYLCVLLPTTLRAQEESYDAAVTVFEQKFEDAAKNKSVSTKIVVAETPAQLESALKFMTTEIATAKALKPGFQLDVLAVTPVEGTGAITVNLANAVAVNAIDPAALIAQDFVISTNIGSEALPYAKQLIVGVDNAALIEAQVPVSTSGMSTKARWVLAITTGISVAGVRSTAMISNGADPVSALIAGSVSGLIELGFQFKSESYMRWVNDRGIRRITGEPAGRVKPYIKRFGVNTLFLFGAQAVALGLGVPIVPQSLLGIMLNTGKYMLVGMPWSESLRRLSDANIEAPNRRRSILLNTIPFGLGMLGTAAATFDMMGVKSAGLCAMGITLGTGVVAWLWTADLAAFKAKASKFVSSSCEALRSVSAKWNMPRPGG